MKIQTFIMQNNGGSPTTDKIVVNVTVSVFRCEKMAHIRQMSKGYKRPQDQQQQKRNDMILKYLIT